MIAKFNAAEGVKRLREFEVKVMHRYDLSPDGYITIRVVGTKAKTEAEAIRNARFRVFGRGFLGREYTYEAVEVR